MIDLESRLRMGLAELAAEVTAPDLCEQVVRSGRRVRRRHRIAATVATAVVLIVAAGSLAAVGEPEPARPATPAVGSYFPSLRPPLPPGWTARRLPAQVPPDGGPSRAAVVTALQRYLGSDASTGEVRARGLHTKGGTVLSADLVEVTVLLPRMVQPRAEPPVTYRVAWLLVSTDYTYLYRPAIPVGCWNLIWTRRHPGACPAPRPTSVVEGNRFDVIDAVSGRGLAAVAVSGDGRTFVTSVNTYIKPVPEPRPPATAVFVWGPWTYAEAAPRGLVPAKTAAQALTVYRRDAANGRIHRHVQPEMHLWLYTARSQSPAIVKRPAWVLFFGNVEEVPVGVPRNFSPAPPKVYTGCLESYVVDATSGRGLRNGIKCPDRQ